MKTAFYDIKTNSKVEMEWEDIMQGIPIGYIPIHGMELNTGKSRLSKFEPTIYWETENVTKL